MGKPGEYQRRKERRQRITDLIVGVLMAAIVLFLIYNIIQSAVNVYDIDNGTLNTYSGGYTYEIRHGTRNISYVFSLDNGDKITALPELTQNEDVWELHSELVFQYSTMPATFFGVYSAVSITSQDGETVFLSGKDSRSEDVGSIWVFSVLLVLVVSVLILPLVLLRVFAKKKTNRKNSIYKH